MVRAHKLCGLASERATDTHAAELIGWLGRLHSATLPNP